MKLCNNKKRVYIWTLLLMVIVMAIFLNSFYWSYEEFSKRKLLVLLIVIFFSIIVPVLVVKVRRFYEFAIVFLQCIEGSINRIKRNKRRVSLFCVIAMLGVGASHMVTYVLSKILSHNTYNVKLFYVLVVLFVLSLILVFAWKEAAQKVEKLFFVIALSLGVFCIGVTADRVGIAWDDQIHYGRALEISNFLNGIMYDVDYQIISYTPNFGATGYDRQSDYAYIENVEAIYSSKASQVHVFENFGIWSLSYVPSALGIIFGRGLNLSYIGVFNMGRFFNLLMYTALVCLAIKKVRYGKMLIATIGLIPTTIFMASNYSYDPWVTGFTILGFAYFFKELQDEEPLKSRNLVIMIAAIGIGCLPKAIYFPLLFPLLFMPKKKFKNDRQRKNYYLAIVGMGMFLVATFLLPILIDSGGVGDIRGGSDVNATEQIRFILKYPLTYMKTLLDFGLDYISLNNAESMLQAYAYSGNGRYYGLISLLLVVLSFLDKGTDEKDYPLIKWMGLFSCAVTILLSTTALYISFTAVGSNTVAGMQARYIIPIVYPALYCLGVGGTKHKINKNAFVCIPMMLVALTMIYNLTVFWVIPY